MFTEQDAYDALKKLSQSRDIKRVSLIERMLRWETGHFTSGQYKATGSAGMEKSKWKREGLPPTATYAKFRDNHTGKMTEFIVWPTVYDFVLYLDGYINRHKGDWPRWNSTLFEAKQNYKRSVGSIDERRLWFKSDGLVKEFRAQPGQRIFPDKYGVYKKTTDLYSTKVGDVAHKNEPIESDPEAIKPDPDIRVAGVEEKKAVGIWQIIKLVADQYSLSQNINDATIAFSQGSLLNYVQKVVQAPWLQFFGDTVGDQYYFQCRKEPFDFEGYQKLPIIKNIQQNEVLSDELAWFSGEVYSWYQIIPRGSFMGEQNLMFAYVKAVFFEEYAEIWGSKPNTQVSNYVNFNKIDEDNKMFKKAVADLRYMVESNAYLPFTRQGSITISGDNSIRRGYKIYYEPTGEFFYVDAVTQNYTVGENGPSFVTTLQVSRGVIKTEFQNYFNLINFNKKTSPKSKIETSPTLQLLFYFDNARTYLIVPDENFEDSDSRSDIKMVNQIDEFPDLRRELDQTNRDNMDKVLKTLNENKDKKFILLGNMDEDSKSSFSKLAENRAKNLKNLIATNYLAKYTDLFLSDLDKLIEVKWNQNADTPYITNEDGKVINYDDSTETVDLKEKAYKRNCLFSFAVEQKETKKESEDTEFHWSVNRPVFYRFLNRKQFVTDAR